MATTIRNQKLFCDHCGDEQIIPFPISIPIMEAMTKAFQGMHKKCEKTWKEPEADQTKSSIQKAYYWMQHGEQGMSSKTIWLCCMGERVERINHPYDPDDFSRCYKLFKMVPEWREKYYMDKIANLSPAWNMLVENWDKLTEMYEKNIAEDWKNYKSVGMYEFMQTLIK